MTLKFPFAYASTCLSFLLLQNLSDFSKPAESLRLIRLFLKRTMTSSVTNLSDSDAFSACLSMDLSERATHAAGGGLTELNHGTLWFWNEFKSNAGASSIDFEERKVKPSFSSIEAQLAGEAAEKAMKETRTEEKNFFVFWY